MLKTNWQSKMADIVNICSKHVYQHDNKMRKSNIRNSRNLKITVIFWSHLVCIYCDILVLFKCTFFLFWLTYALHIKRTAHLLRPLTNQVNCRYSVLKWSAFQWKHSATIEANTNRMTKSLIELQIRIC